MAYLLFILCLIVEGVIAVSASLCLSGGLEGLLWYGWVYMDLLLWLEVVSHSVSDISRRYLDLFSSYC